MIPLRCFKRIMKWHWLTIGLFAFTSISRGAEPLTQRVTKDEFKDAGLDKLTPAERAKLDAIVAKYFSSDADARVAEAQAIAENAKLEAAIAQQEVQKQLMAQQAAEKAKQEAVVAKEAAEKQVAAQQQASPQKEKPSAGWLSKVMVKTGTKVEYEPIESQIVGKFHGWNGNTIIELKNGQIWKQANTGDTYVAVRPLDSPKVTIRPSSFGGFKISVEGVNIEVRVKLLNGG